MLLYYRILSEEHRCYVSKEEILLNGITFTTKSNTVPKVGLGNPIIEGAPYDKDIERPYWLDFNKAIPCWIEKPRGDYVYFSRFTDKIRVFDGDISYDIVEQINCELLDGFDEQEIFETGKSLKDLYNNYWKSMMLLDIYIEERPYLNPEVFIFEAIPSSCLKSK